MKDFTDKQNEIFGKLFNEIKKQNPVYETDALTLLSMNDENFITIYNDPNNKLIGDDEDIELCHERALKLNQK